MPTSLLILMLSAGASVEIHVDRDANGVIRFSDAANASGVAQTERLKLAPRVGTRAPTKYRRPKPKPHRKRTAGKRHKSRDQRETACFKAREQLTQIENKRRHGYTAKQDQPLRDAWDKQNRRRRFYCR